MAKKRTMGVPKLGSSKIDWGAMEKRSTMGKYDIFEAGRRSARSLSRKYRKSHGRKKFKWTM